MVFQVMLTGNSICSVKSNSTFKSVTGFAILIVEVISLREIPVIICKSKFQYVR